MDTSNYTLLYDALRTFRDAMLPFIITRLKETYGNVWWHDGVKRVLGESVLAELEATRDRRYKKPLSSVEASEIELYEQLDINRFVQLVEGNWRAFAAVFKQRNVITTWLGEINDMRNAVAHPETGDINPADAARAVDTMKRILRVVDANAAERIGATFVDLAAADARNRGPRELRRGPYDYEIAFLALEEALEKGGERAAADLQAVRDLRHELMVIFSAEEFSADELPEELEGKRTAIIATLDELARKVLQKGVADVALVTALPETPNEAHARIREIEAEIVVLEDNLRAQRQRRATQQQTRSIPLASLERAIARTERMIDRCRREIEHIRNEIGPAAFFRVARELTLASRPLIEEQRFTVTTQLTNLGRRSALVAYTDRVSANLRIVEGSLAIDAAIAPGNTFSCSYTCEAVQAGPATIGTGRIAYAHRSDVWDELSETEIEVEDARPPCLLINRYHHATPGGKEILLRIENTGDRAAHNVVCRDVMTDPNGRETILDFKGDIDGHTAMNVAGAVAGAEVETLVTLDTPVSFEDASGTRYSLTIRAGVSRLEPVFPKIHADLPFVDADAKLQALEEAVRSFRAAAQTSAPPPRQRLLRIQGLEGSGKSRLVYELKQLARRLDLQFADTDLSRVRPVRGLIARVFGITADLDDADAVAQSLRRSTPEDEKAPQREAIARFLTEVDVPPEQYTTVSGHVQAAIRDLARAKVLVLAIENLQAPVEGIEAHVLRAITNHALAATTSYVLPCLTHRPGPDSALTIFSSIHVPDDQQWRIDPATMDERAVAEIADKITHYPRIAESLCADLAEWSHGNPLYVIEALRDLLSGDTLLEQIGDEYYPAAGVSLQKLAARGLYEVVASRAKNELSAEDAEFARTLAAIGFELPLALTKAVVESKHGDWQTRIERLIDAGVLVSTRKERRNFAPYEFEHQVKHRVFYDALSEVARLELEQTIATILLNLKEQKYRTPEDQIVEAARHLCATAAEFQSKHALAIVAAARIQTKRRNFTAALALYQAVSGVIPETEPARAEICIERARIHVLRGEGAAASEELSEAAKLLSNDSQVVFGSRVRARRLEFLLRKEQGLLTLQQPSSPFDARATLERARHLVEAPFGLRRLFPPARIEFYRDLVDIYVGLAESALRRGEDGRCNRYCWRAARLAKKAQKISKEAGLLSAVYQRFGRLHAKQRRADAFEQARKWYELGLSQAADDPYERERILVPWADALAVAGKDDEAVEKYEQAIELQTELADVQGLALSYSGIAEILEERFAQSSARRDMADLALKYYKMAFELRGYIPEVERKWRICAGLTRLCLNRGDVAAARPYWAEARTILFDQNHIYRVGDADLASIHRIVVSVTDAYERQKYAEDAAISSGDLTLILELVPDVSEAEKASAHLRYGDALKREGDVRGAIAEYETAMEKGATADGHERLGDLFAARAEGAKKRRFTEDSERDEAEEHYEQSVSAHLLRGNMHRALAVFEKLLRRMTSDPSGILEVPLMFIRVFDGVPGHMDAQKPLLDQSIAMLDGNGRPADAADVIVEALHYWLRTDDSINEGKVAEYLARAEELYRKATQEELMAGLDNLISVDFKLKAWQVIVRRFEELFELQIAYDDPEEVLESLSTLWNLRELVPTEHMVRFAEIAAGVPNRVRFEPAEVRRWRFWHSKLMISAGMNNDGAEALLDRGLALMNEIIDMATWEADDLLPTAYNDSALVERKRGNLDEAMRRFNLAIEHDPDRPLVYLNRGSLRREVGNLDDAKDDLEKAYELATLKDDYYVSADREGVLSSRQVAMLNNMINQRVSIGQSLGSFLITTGSDAERGRQICLEAIEILERFGMRREAELHRLNLAVLSYESGGRISVLRDLYAPAGGETQCGHCGAMMPRSASACRRCGTRACPACRTPVAAEATECSYCHARFCAQCGMPAPEDEVLCDDCADKRETTPPPPPPA